MKNILRNVLVLLLYYVPIKCKVQFTFVGYGIIFIKPSLHFEQVNEIEFCFINCVKYENCLMIGYDEERLLCYLYHHHEFIDAVVELSPMPIYRKEKDSNDDIKRDYEKIGCFNDNQSYRTFPSLLLTHRELGSSKSDGHKTDWKNWNDEIQLLTRECANLTRKNGFNYFGLQNYGECWSGFSETFYRYGESDKCTSYDYIPCNDCHANECCGIENINYVYKLLPKDDPQVHGSGMKRKNLNKCSNTLCNGKSNGKYQFKSFLHECVKSVILNNKEYFDYYFTCNATIAYCVPCPLNTYYHQQCDQCLEASRIANKYPCHNHRFNKSTIDTEVYKFCPVPAAANIMTDCSRKGISFSGNLVDSRNNTKRSPTSNYFGCWKGKYFACMLCSKGLTFHELRDWNGNFYFNGHCEVIN